MEPFGPVSKIKMVVFDVDGVFTDGRTWQDPQGAWRRYFSVRDTMGIRALRKAGYKVAVVTATLSEEIRNHVSFVGVDAFKEDCGDKARALAELTAQFGFESSEVCYATEDEKDIPVFSKVGFGATISSAKPSVQKAAGYVTSREGGDGAVLEICNLIIQQGSVSNLGSKSRPISA